MDSHIRATAELLAGWTGPVIYGDIFPANTPVRWVVSAYGAGGMANGTDPKGIRLDLTRPEVAHRIADVARAGVRCPNRLHWFAFGAPGDTRDVPTCPDCARPATDRDPYLRAPHEIGHWLPVALGGKAPTIGALSAAEVSGRLLARSWAGILAGVGPVRGMLGRWVGMGWCGRDAVAGEQVHVVLALDGWKIGNGSDIIAQGSETGAEGRAAADRAALAAGFALVTDGALVLPALTPASSGAPASGDER